MARYKCFIKHCKASRPTNSALIHHLHQHHTKSQREKVPKEKYSEILYDLCKCGFLVNFKKISCKHCGAEHLKKSPKDISIQRKSELKKNITVDKDNLPSLESILSTSVRIHSHVPGYCQRLWKESLNSFISSVLFNKDLTSWKKLAMISKCLLLKPKRAGKKSKRFTKNWTLDRFEKWKSGDFVDLWHETLKYQNTSNRNHESSLESEQLRRCISLAREGNASKSLSSLSSTPIL